MGNLSIGLGSHYFVNADATEEEVRTGIQAMAASGLKLVRIFLQWDHVERQSGKWHWTIYDALFDAAAANGLGVIVTLMAVHPPGWMRLTTGPQGIGPLEDESFWSQALYYVQQAVTRYAAHNALHSWILWNEPSRALAQNSGVLHRWQKYLRERYHNNIDRLNTRAYQQLSSFSDVEFPNHTDMFSNYIERMDWMRFSVYLLHQYLQAIATHIRMFDPTHPIHVNPAGLASDMSSVGQSIWESGRTVDFLGCSAHPSWHSTRFPPGRTHQSVAFFADLTRSATRASRRYFWVTELQGGTNIYSAQAYLCPSANDLRLWMWESIGAGAKAVVFWCFNTRRQGFEAGEWSLLNQLGQPSDRLDAVTDVAAILEKHSQLLAESCVPRVEVALIYSEATWRLGRIEGQGSNPSDPRNSDMGADALIGAYLACADAGIPVDFLDEQAVQSGDVSAYKTLIAPGCTALEDATIMALKDFVSAGGTLVADGLFGFKDEDGRIRSDSASLINELFGAAVADIKAVPRSTHEILEGLQLPAWFLDISLLPSAGTQILAYNSRTTQVAATMASVGCGTAIRVGTVFFQHYFSTPASEQFAVIRNLLSITRPLVALGNPSPQLRMRVLEAPSGVVIVLMNSGAATVARIEASNNREFVELTAEGETRLSPQEQRAWQVPMADLSVRLILCRDC